MTVCSAELRERAADLLDGGLARIASEMLV